jgi:hypothetical protein
VSAVTAAVHKEMWRLPDPVAQPVLPNPIGRLAAAVQRILDSTNHGKN